MFFGYHDEELTKRHIGGELANGRNVFADSWNWDVRIWPLVVPRQATHFLLTTRQFLAPPFHATFGEMGRHTFDHLAEPIKVRFNVITREPKPLLLHGNSFTSLETRLSIEHVSDRIRVYHFNISVDDMAEDWVIGHGRLPA
jgi:hypothetical protein